jgi:hypothetical protein
MIRDKMGDFGSKKKQDTTAKPWVREIGLVLVMESLSRLIYDTVTDSSLRTPSAIIAQSQ